MRRLRVRMDIMIYDAHNQASYKLLNPFMTPRPFNARYLQARYKPVTSPRFRCYAPGMGFAPKLGKS